MLPENSEAMQVLNKMVPALRGMAKSLEVAITQLTAEPPPAPPEPPRVLKEQAVMLPALAVLSS